MRRFVLVCSCFSTLSICVAQQSAGARPHVVTASGEAIVSAKPDMAEVSLSVENIASSAAVAVSANAERTTRVIAALKGIVPDKDHLKTSGYSLQPEMVYPHEGEPPRVSGYKAANSVVVIVDDLSAIGKAIDAASAAGATAVNGIDFRVKNDASYKLQALSEAAKEARAHADVIVKALRLEVVGVLEAHVADLPTIAPQPQPRMMMLAKAATPTPIAEGSVDIHARVDITLEVR